MPGAIRRVQGCAKSMSIQALACLQEELRLIADSGVSRVAGVWPERVHLSITAESQELWLEKGDDRIIFTGHLE
jgi:hypothetical protein